MTNDDQIRLALRWSIPNITEDQLLTSTMDWNDSNKIEQNRSLLLDGLSKNLQVFVRNFIQLDTDLSVLLGYTADTWRNENWSSDNDYLRELYSETKRKNPDPLYLLDKIDQKLNFKKQTDLNRILEMLVSDFMDTLYEDPSKGESVPEKSKRTSKVDPMNPDVECGCELNVRSSQTTRKNVESIYRDIFLWCIVTYRLAMAKIILGQMKSRICSALIASKILKSLTQYAPDHGSKEILRSEADVFETYAIEFVRCSYMYNKQQTCELIIRQVDLYGNVTCLQMAIAGDNKKFLNEDACQALLTNIWYDKVDPVQERTRLVVNLLTMGISQLFISTYEKHFSENRSIQQETNFGYILFLLLFSYYMLYAFNPLSDDTIIIHWAEILTIITVTSMFLEEARQFYFQESQKFKGKLLTYFDWNNRLSNLFLILPAYLLFYVGLILRFILRGADNFSAARIVLAYDLELWFIIAVLFVGVTPDLGPKLAMIRKMVGKLY
ncbi:unnamed protein product [Adineta steineri]|uniref:TRPM-like domain-containing protein n=1 Tax=Adineta steineri TaxID=433720 RepID=A0A813MPD1_9BILA|nr:unnamed protein product [Adineta steineri]CAF1512983.1 unnamed protein product [Adineta steineri]